MQTYKLNSTDARLDVLRDQHIGKQLSIAKLNTKTGECKIKKLLRQIDEINEKKLQLYREGQHANSQ